MTTNKKPAPGGTGTGSGTAFAGQILAEIPKNAREVYRITRRTYKGYPLVDVRVWFDDPVTGELRPGKGLTIKVQALPEIVAALSGLIEGGRR